VVVVVVVGRTVVAVSVTVTVVGETFVKVTVSVECFVIV